MCFGPNQLTATTFGSLSMLPGDFYVVMFDMTCLLIWDCKILPKKEPHRSLQVCTCLDPSVHGAGTKLSATGASFFVCQSSRNESV